MADTRLFGSTEVASNRGATLADLAPVTASVPLPIPESTRLASASERPMRDAGALVVQSATATALLGAASIHAAVALPHYREWPPAGLFFLAIQLVETVLAVATILRWTSATRVLIAATCLGTVTVWAVSRTSGLPVGPQQFRHPEGIGVPDLACLVLEAAAAAAVLVSVRPGRAAASGPYGVGVDRSPMVAGALVALLALVGAVGLRAAAVGGAEHEHARPVQQILDDSSPQPEERR